MPLLTPKNLYHILSLSILSRLLVIFIQLISNLIIPDHNADAYRNRYHSVLSKNDTEPSNLNHFYKPIQGLTNWDSQYFLEITNDGYVSEQHLAFLPLFPVAISFIKQLLFSHDSIKFDHLIPTTVPTKSTTIKSFSISQIQIDHYIRSAVVGVALNNFIFFPIACITLFALTKVVIKKDEKYSRSVVWWFCFNPASIFFSACYSESLFATLSFTVMLVIEHLADKYHSDTSRPKDEARFFADYNRILKICLPTVIPLALSGATRSNGLANIGFIYYQFILKYSQFWQSTKLRWNLTAYVFFVLEFIQDLIALVMLTVVGAAGYITYQIYSYIKFCTGSNKKKGVLNAHPEWCKSALPHPYGHVQAKYWNVGPFYYYEMKQLPNFLLALPMTYLVLAGSLKKSREVAKTRNITHKRQLVYYIHGIVLTVFCGISINVQVTTRLLASSCPVVYWIAADWAQQSRPKGKILVTYFLSYFLLGTILHANFYPWT